MPIPTTTSASAQCTAILKFWHKVEFFIPYDLQRQVLEDSDAEWSVRTFSRRALENVDVSALWQTNLPVGRKLVNFDVFLGVFDKSELTEVTQRVVRHTLTPEQEYEQEQRGEMDGLTCFARLMVSDQGASRLEAVSVSTAPWALGCIQHKGLSGLDFDAFQGDIETLKESLCNFRVHRTAQPCAPHSTSNRVDEITQSTVAKPLTGSELLELLEILYCWADYVPQPGRSDEPVLVIRANSVEENKKKAAEKIDDRSAKDNASKMEDDDDVSGTEDSDIDILNSFYAQDIARVIASLQQGDACPALESYLTPTTDAQRIDLYTPVGRQQIIDQLLPDRQNTGHWLDTPHHAMSLMQQFAINSAFEKLKTPGIFSVNGPPGTGKTTLLRDLFAENIVRRARALAAYTSSGDAFLPDLLKVDFMGAHQPCLIAQLREELTGFEMVVASSNNAAVENISRDLPKTKSLGKSGQPGENPWRDAQGKATVGYLQPIAHNIAARDSKGNYDKLTVDDTPWGLICCVLGNKTNRHAFVERLSFAGAKFSQKAPKNFDPERHQSIWTWRDHYNGPSYAAARQAFLKADQAVKTTLEQMSAYARLQQEMQEQNLSGYTTSATQLVQLKHQLLVDAQTHTRNADDEWKFCNAQLALLDTEEKLIEKRYPGWWARLTNASVRQDYCSRLEANHQQQGVWLRRKIEVDVLRHANQKAEQQATAAYETAQQQLAHRQADWHAKQMRLAQWARDFPQADCPKNLDDLEQARWQIDGLWRNAALNKNRSELFAAALQLQESWLAEVLKKGGRFGSNVVAMCQLLSGVRPQEAAHALAIWRSVFMVVPVVSTTFASFARQFLDLGANTLGWLFIDEAGQAVPQAAVGALWRAKRAVVVGDPLQIEPVFTVPIPLIEALADCADLPSDMDVAPHHVSVQNLADSANTLGTWIGSGAATQWIGSPLRVHRRCVDPMFSIANAIAYEGKMIYFDPDDSEKRRPPADSLDIGPSAWVSVQGKANDKQAVSAQINLVHQALAALYQRTASLPPLYIISPFKRIRELLVRRIANPENWAGLVSSGGIEVPKKSALQVWAKARIGTVHTFQGKEESIVWLVLGCDIDTLEAAEWVAAKPNLLNVALTRAQHRFVMIGDVKLWGGLPHFRAAHREALPRLRPDQFLLQLQQISSTTTA